MLVLCYILNNKSEVDIFYGCSLINFYGLLEFLLYYLRGVFPKNQGFKGALHFILKQIFKNKRLF
ncbi:hypothetical protein EPC67_04590 [Helicobacter pylori]|uniref:Uncharacterized protein n=1 Tax=Helicobacter pylori TaxID=210 RepID=A0A083YCQ3_HELPX|nr:hypothetical protein [Helicobacter pylori]KAA6513773.1 hypothetical protein EPC67_04590 [Helicobacter pylori]KEY38582.1 hypothetical protein GZ76_08500 [Helicobacter pylori]MUU48316.1 hypothetical protein [Helicobacter pylori]OOC18773.1 hypothetical protein BV499_01660 [Helicobacter pylori]OOQ02144.1 hypothetical protein B0X50_02350 [Helicobacter pylori]